MRLELTGRHVTITPTVRKAVEQRLARLSRVLNDSVHSVQVVITKEKSDSMQSFLFAETFKYFYLLFAPPRTLNFDKVIFNTEAHPIRRTW